MKCIHCVAKLNGLLTILFSSGPAGFFNMYLVDVVTGHIVFHENHKRTHGPVSVVHAENWVVVSSLPFFFFFFLCM
jgi:hypothetical protein